MQGEPHDRAQRSGAGAVMESGNLADSAWGGTDAGAGGGALQRGAG